MTLTLFDPKTIGITRVLDPSMFDHCAKFGQTVLVLSSPQEI
jgi:hypothetical protein